MPNSYAVAPGTIVGSQTVTGDEIVTGEVIAGSGATRKAHLYGLGLVSEVGFNYDLKNAARDTAGQMALSVGSDSGGMGPYIRLIGAAGTQRLVPLPIPISALSGHPSVTGTLAEVNYLDAIVPGGVLASFGQLKIRFYISTTVQGAGVGVIRIRYGGTIAFSVNVAAVGERVWDVVMTCDAFPNQQRTSGVVHTNGANPSVGFNAFAVDSSVDQHIVISAQPGQVTDVHTCNFAEVMMWPGGVQF